MNNQTFEFEKQGIKFCFRNPKLDQYGKLLMEHKIIGIKENKNNDGYYYSSEFIPTKNIMSLYDVKINGKKINGVMLPEDISTEVKTIFEQFKIEREQNITQIINELKEGKRNIHFSIVGCDYPHYQPWLKDLSKDLNGLEQEIMTKAIKEIVGENEWVFNACEYIEKKVKKHVGFLEELGDVLNPEYDSESHEYHGYKKEIVTGFEMNLNNILQSSIEKNKEKKIKDQVREARKNEMQVKILKKGKIEGGDGTDYYANVEITDGVETLRFGCRNIFDFGYVINPLYSISEGLEPGGIQSGDYWQTIKDNEGWVNVRLLTEFEKKALKYLSEFSPIDTEIRL
jgi:hypothetical protein